jgi:hypothetical protein
MTDSDVKSVHMSGIRVVDKKVCYWCSDIDKPVKNCAKCKAVWYCSVDCQSKHWPVHKLECNRELRKAADLSTVLMDRIKESRTGVAIIGAMLHHFAAPLSLCVVMIRGKNGDKNGPFNSANTNLPPSSPLMECEFKLLSEEFSGDFINGLAKYPDKQLLFMHGNGYKSVVSYFDDDLMKEGFNVVSRVSDVTKWKLPMKMVVGDGCAALIDVD